MRKQITGLKAESKTLRDTALKKIHLVQEADKYMKSCSRLCVIREIN